MKKYLIYGGIALAAMSWYSQKKYKEAVTVLDTLTFSISKISNIKLVDVISTKPRLKFDAIFSIKNNSNFDFGATLSSKIVVKQIRVFTNDDIFLAAGDLELFQVNLPAGKTMALPQITFYAYVKDLLKVIGSNYEQIINGDISNLRFEIDINAFGKVLTVDV